MALFPSLVTISVTEHALEIESGSRSGELAEKGLQERPGTKNFGLPRLKFFQELAPVSIQAVREYLALLWKRYQVLARREERSEVLDEICRNLGINRKSAIRLMRSEGPPKKRRGPTKAPRRRYSDAAREAVKVLWRRTGCINSKRLKAACEDWLPHWKDGELSTETQGELLRMSASTMERILRQDKAAMRRRQQTGTKRMGRIVTSIPVKNLGFEAKNPGFGEIDTVMHCGDWMSGTFARSLTFVDLDLGWVECEAMPDGQGVSVKSALTEIEKRFPFRLLGLYADGGSEFWNEDVLPHLTNPDREVAIDFGRGRAYRKNDQAHVEQKNFTHVRQTFGWDRISGKVAVNMMNNIYRKEWRLLQNFFLPQMQLEAKTRVGGSIKRTMGDPKTPYRRALESPAVPPETKQMLLTIRESLNPFELRSKLAKKLKQFRRYLKVDGNQPYNGRFHDEA
jgi:hypothetical protein